MALLDINRIRTDGGTQIRVKKHDDAIEEYSNAYLDDEKLPPVEIIFDGEHYWLWDGHHRVAGAVQAGKRTINVNVVRGTLREAIEKAISANRGHGIRRSNDDKLNAVMTMLRDDEWRKLDNREIARRAGVSHTMVNLRRNPPTETTQVGGEAGQVETVSSVTGKPELTKAQQKRAAKAAAKKAAKEAAEKSGPVTTTRPKPAQLGAVEDIARERDEYKGKVVELGSMLESTVAELAVYQNATTLGSVEMALQAENKQLREQVAALQSEVDGLLEEKNAAIKTANRWKRKAKAGE